MDGFAEGFKFYLQPDLAKLEGNFLEAVWAAMGQAFFTLSIGMGGIAIFGSYMSDKNSLLNEACFIAFIDTCNCFTCWICYFSPLYPAILMQLSLVQVQICCLLQ